MEISREPVRQYDLDWIKILVMLIVFLYHCSMFFNSFDWHIKNNVIDHTYIEIFSLLVGNWIMPAFFVISGISTFYALKKSSPTVFLKARGIRLGIPLLVGVFLLSPPQVYIERVTAFQFEGSFFRFFPHYFDGLYLEMGGTGNFAFFGHHLWYLLMLLLFSALTLPFFRKGRLNISDKPFHFAHYFVLQLPIVVAAIFANHIVNLGSWGIFVYLILYIYGFYFFTRASLRDFVRHTGLVTGAFSLISILGYVMWVMIFGFPLHGTTGFLLFIILRVFLTWNILFFILYLGDRYLNFSNGALSYSSEASMPFYVLHQPIIILVGFFIYSTEWSVAVKMLFLVFVAFALIMSIYHFLIRRSNKLRVLFGLRSKKPTLS